MAGELWRDLLPLLRARDRLAWSQVAEECFANIHAGLLLSARKRNSSFGAPMTEAEVQDMATLLTDEAFLQAMQDIDNFDPERSALPTWIRWKGMSRLKGVLDPELRARTSVDSLDAPARRRADYRDHLQAPPPSSASAEAEALRSAGEAATRARIDAILAAMRPDWANALIRVWLARQEGSSAPIKAAAEAAGLSQVAMDSLFRRAARDFHARWQAQDGDDLVRPPR